MKRASFKKSLLNSLFILFVFFVFNTYQRIYPQKTSTPASPTPTEIQKNNNIYKVTRIIDGDTIEIDTGEKVRYIGIDTPELHHPQKAIQCFGDKAMEKNKQLVEGKSVRLEKDVSEVDKYKRLLRYVYLIDTASSNSALFINEILVREGYARLATYPPDIKYQAIFLEAEKEARENKRGLWNGCY